MAEDWIPKDNWSPNNHDHDSKYSKLDHVHDYASSDHNHDAVYSKLDHTHSQYVVPGDYVVDQGVTSDGIYRKWNSGLLEQWGHSTSTTHGTPQKITFAKSYANTNYRITGCYATAKSVGPNDWWNNKAAGLGMTLGFGSFATDSCDWVAVWTCDGNQGMEVNVGYEIDWYAIGTAAFYLTQKKINQTKL